MRNRQLYSKLGTGSHIFIDLASQLAEYLRNLAPLIHLPPLFSLRNILSTGFGILTEDIAPIPF